VIGGALLYFHPGPFAFSVYILGAAVMRVAGQGVWIALIPTDFTALVN
jgi:hypothetical protein